MPPVVEVGRPRRAVDFNAKQLNRAVLQINTVLEQFSRILPDLSRLPEVGAVVVEAQLVVAVYDHFVPELAIQSTEKLREFAHFRQFPAQCKVSSMY